MADLEIRVERATDAERYLASDKLIWFDRPGSEPIEVQLLGVPEDQRFAAQLPAVDVDPTTYPGIYGVRPMQLGVPDGQGAARLVPVAGLTWVGVHPDHRRKGLLTAMLRHHFQETHDAGVHLSALHASEPSIYGRHGYGLASLEHTAELGRGTTFTAPGLEDEVAAITTRLSTVNDKGMAQRRRACDLALGAQLVGVIVGDEDFFEELSHVSPEEVRDEEPPRIIFASRDGEDVGYAVFRRKHKWDNARPGAKVEVGPISGGPAALLALLRRLVDLDLAGTTTVHGIGSDSPLLSWVQGPRATGDLHTYDSLWVRLVDLPEALASRGYEGDPCDVVVEIVDDPAPWNAGRWRIRVGGGEAEATRSDEAPDATMNVEALGAAYLGGRSLLAMRNAGTVTEHRPGAVRELWRAMRTDVMPQATRGF
jgi:GNAT superfamily N-acetyltransferase